MFEDHKAGVFTIDYAKERDKKDPLNQFRDAYHFPECNKGRPVIYLCGNSLGLQPRKMRESIDEFLNEWKNLGVRGHFDGSRPWLNIDSRINPMMSDIVGARDEEIVIMNALSVNLHMMLASFYRPTGNRDKILMESDAFPSDRYAVTSYLSHLGKDPDQCVLFIKPRKGEYLLHDEDILNYVDSHGHEIALILLGNPNYYTGQLFDMKEITDMGHRKGCIVGFDCAHGAGNVPLNLHDNEVDFAIWCTYKYLNSGPGNIGGVFIHEMHGSNPDIPRLSGWWGEDQKSRFQMRDEFTPEKGAAGWQISNPPIIGLAALECSLRLHNEAGIERIREKSINLTAYLEKLIESHFRSRIKIITPRDKNKRGAQLSLLLNDSALEVHDKLIEKGVIIDWREPNVLRVSPAPMYNSYEDVFLFVQALREIID